MNLTWIVGKWDKFMRFLLAECPCCDWTLTPEIFSTINSRLCNPIHSLSLVVWEFLLVWVWICSYRQQNWIWVTHIKCASVLTSSYYVKLETTDFLFSLVVLYKRKHKMPLQFALRFPAFLWKAYWLKPFMGLNRGLTIFWFFTWLQYRLAVQIHIQYCYNHDSWCLGITP